MSHNVRWDGLACPWFGMLLLIILLVKDISGTTAEPCKTAKPASAGVPARQAESVRYGVTVMSFTIVTSVRAF